MATKVKSAPSAETIETAVKTSAAVFKDGFAKAAKGYDTLVAFSKENAEAVMESATVAGKGFGTINSEVLAYSRFALEESIAATKALMGVKSVDEFIKLQTSLSKSAFETYVGKATKVKEMAISVAKETAEPIKARATAFAKLVQAHAA